MALRVALATLACAALAGCAKPVPVDPLLGHWSVDLEATLAGARAAGMPPDAEPRIRGSYARGTLDIAPGAIDLGLAGSPDKLHATYVRSKGPPGCARLKLSVAAAPGPHDFCVAGDRLELHDPDSALVVVYKRG